MNLKEYFDQVYFIYKTLFSAAGTQGNSPIIGSIREEIIKRLLSFFPEPKETGWIFSNDGKTTGQIDIVIPYSMCVLIPGYVFAEEGAKGFLSNQVSSAIEVKSNIGSEINNILIKSWSCHRLIGGFENIPETETINKNDMQFIYKNWVPFVVIGNRGFKEDEAYLKWFEDFSKLTYSVNKKAIEKPTKPSQVIPDLLLDLKYNKLLIHKHLNPNIPIQKFDLLGSSKDFSEFSIITVTEKQGGLLIKILLYYLDSLRKVLSVSQLTTSANLLDI